MTHASKSQRTKTAAFLHIHIANTTSGVYLGLIMFMQPEAPYNEGMYRPIEIDYGRPVQS